MERFGSHMETFGGQIGSEQSMIPFQSFGPFSIFGMMREWYQGDEDDLHEWDTCAAEFLQAKRGEVEQEDLEEHDLLTLYSTKNLTPEKTEKDNPDTMKLKVIKHRKIFWKIRKLKLNSPEGQDKDFV